MSEAQPLFIHLSARVRGMKAELFPRGELEDMLQQYDLQRLSDHLLESPYRDEMADSLTRYQGADAVEDAVSRNLVHTFQRVQRAARGEAKEPVRLLLMRWDLLAVKSLLRCRHHNITGEAAYPWLVPGPTLTVPIQHDLVREESMENLVDGLVAWNRSLCRGLRDAFADYRESDDLRVLEEALDRAYFAQNVRNLDKNEDPHSETLKQLLKTEIDRINLRVVFQFLQLEEGKGAAREELLKGGHISVDTLGRMLDASDVAGALEQLAGTRYESLVDEIRQDVEAGRFGPVERHFDHDLMHFIRSLARKDVFGLGVVMDYLWMKYNEVINLRLIARGLAGNLPTGRVKEELYFV